MFKIITILSVTLVAVTAYDFKDTFFNQYLFEDYKSLNENLLSRQRRDASDAPTEGVEKGGQCGGRLGESKKDFTCCETTKADPSFFVTIKEAQKECATKFRANNSDVENIDPFNCGQMEKIKELIFCESECVAKTFGHLDEEGNLQRDIIDESFKKQFPEADEATLKVLNSHVDKCLNKIKDLDLKPENKCNRTPMEMHHCMFGEMILGCPAESQVKSPRCDKIRESFSKGEKQSVGSHALHEFLHHGKHHGHHHNKE